ncbi:phosphatases II [Metschnikowia bicuspidata var. bicuspidata NRRL YB-4993]|uniref:phosphatidylinositol-3,4,5-trisphosphate 3-phosphatase n=1 Tax=Metschnikowia bicuspidata var. bicuspidata NRRL YB-4993 TaxID=869754 RepID=A0A1A0HCI3_9ASCO|nr:phosphatases II [Metschnikowia bicuspidata var. bicuspidata NRRL YB-4993]OBA21700.1 phosphatases II [Metschnikowia bicuspidata var. bicuspidata NRRL YB-4993]
MNPENIIRALVSVPKKGYYDAEDFLDLSYVTPRIIVAAGPSDNFVSNIFRSPVDRVVSHLNRYRSGDQAHWHIWNLRGEGSGYSVNDIPAEYWSYYPFPDQQPPSVTFLISITREISDFFQLSPRNVALIHCREGKGRSGTVCCALLMYEAKLKGIYMSVDEAIAMFTRRRMRKYFGPGVLIYSQVRYLSYWKTYLLLSDNMIKNYQEFDSHGSVPFDISRSVITKITVIRPTLLLVLSKFKILTYTEKGNGLEEELLRTQSLGLPHISANTSFLDVPMNIPITAHMKDIKISFERQFCIAYAWFNLFFETLGDSKRPLPHQGASYITAKRLVLPWELFDGTRGFKVNSNFKLFDRIEILWVYHFPKS